MKTSRPAEGGCIRKEMAERIDFPRLPAHTASAFSCSPASGSFLPRNKTGCGVLFCPNQRLPAPVKTFVCGIIPLFFPFPKKQPEKRNSLTESRGIGPYYFYR
jgi:hypothetical protein